MSKFMFLSFIPSILRRLASDQRRPILHAGVWTLLLTLTTALASLPPILAFISASSSSISRSCSEKGFVRMPLDVPGDGVCLPAFMVRRSETDFFVPTLFAGFVVVGSSCVLRSFALSDNE